MSPGSKSVWSKECAVEVDQRDKVLPPTWVARTPAPGGEFDGREHVFRSEGGRAAASAIVAGIEAATEFVVVASFLFGDAAIERALVAAARRGVRVYLLIASEARLAKEPRDDSEFDQKLVAEHKSLLQRIAGWVLVRSSLAFHAKVVLIDPHARRAGWLLTANLTQEALERNEEIAVTLSAAEIAAAYECLRWAAWESADHQLVEPGDFLGVKPLGCVERPSPGGGIAATLCGPGSLRREVLGLIDAAEREIVVSSFGFDIKHEVVQRLLARAREGLRITILARTRPATMPALIELRRAGARVLGFRWLHAKAVWTDKREGIVMSANLESKGLDEGFELGVHATGKRAAALRALLEFWIGSARWELHAESNVGACFGAALAWNGSQFLELDVAQHAVVPGPRIVAASADRLESASPPVPSANGLPLPAHRLTLRWVIEAPRLAAGSKPLDPKGTTKPKGGEPAVLPRFREPSGRLVVAIRDAADLERARAVVASGGAHAVVVMEAQS